MPPSNQHRGLVFAFVSGAMPDEHIDLIGLQGHEELSQPFEFTLIAAHHAPFTTEQIDGLLNSPCALALGPGEHDTVHGVLASVELLDAARGVPARYLLRMVPTLSVLGLTRSCRVFQDMTVVELCQSLLGMYGLKADEDFDLRVHAALPKHEYVVQYQESDLAFLQRRLEHEGLFYWFEHGAGGERLVIADENADTTPIAEPTTLSYRERNNLTTGDAATVWGWQLYQQRIAARVAVLDYNYRTPHIPLGVAADVGDASGFGSVFHYGEHFKSPEEGRQIARLRAEQLACQRRTYTGRTDCPRFRVGHTFSLENHHDATHDGTYLITALEHRAGRPVRSGDVEDYLDEAAAETLCARFTAIPIDVPFRPARTTERPQVHGILHAHIAGDTSGQFAEIDDFGRYKVRLPFDSGGPKGSKCSRWIRMAQSYSGGGYGSHFPLHKGTEVLLAHIDGDPDRPVIVGSVPNARTLSPSTSANATQSVIQTASGIRIEMEDQEG